MSLVCHECGKDLQPGDSLPGREGVFVHPNVISAVWALEGDEIKWLPVFVETPHNRSLCFECIIKNLFQGEVTAALSGVFSAYQAETKFRQIDKGQKGKWIDSGNDRGWLDSYEVFKREEEKIPQETCLSCGAAVPGLQKAFFSLTAIDRVSGCQNPSPFGSYQWSNVKSGQVSFKLCFDCCSNSFPRIFKQLSCDLRRIENPEKDEVIKNELYVAPEILAVLETVGNA